VNVQIFDCSGDTKYVYSYINKLQLKLSKYRFEHTWPAMSYKLNGTVIVYNPDDKKQADELNSW
jgi:hypothetical protein